MSPSKDNLARSATKVLFTQPLSKDNSARSAENLLMRQANFTKTNPIKLVKVYRKCNVSFFCFKEEQVKQRLFVYDYRLFGLFLCTIETINTLLTF